MNYFQKLLGNLFRIGETDQVIRSDQTFKAGSIRSDKSSKKVNMDFIRSAQRKKY